MTLDVYFRIFDDDLDGVAERLDAASVADVRVVIVVARTASVAGPERRIGVGRWSGHPETEHCRRNREDDSALHDTSPFPTCPAAARIPADLHRSRASSQDGQ
jgi:hypothetical protein